MSQHHQLLGILRAQQPEFQAHNKAIAPDGFAAQSAHMRGPDGLRLLHAEHIQFLRPEELRGKGGQPLTPQMQRVYFGVYVWKSVWGHFPEPPRPPTDEEYLTEVARVQAIVGTGRMFEDPLDGVYLAPNDFCSRHGKPYSKRTQRRMFRAALAAACEAALQCYKTHQRKLGQRLPMTSTALAFTTRQKSPQRYEYGRPDLPSYAPENLRITRPYGIPTNVSTAPGYWLSPTTQEQEEE